jgi:uncharacterized protein (TIGR00661 family)
MAETRNGKRILVAALDWGLGHATRLIPIIEALRKLQFEIVLASSGNALHYLQQTYPHLPSVALPPYNPTYHDSGNMAWAMAKQTPKFLNAIYQEHKALKKIVIDYQIQGIISDNRYGLFHKKIPSVFITNQLFIQTPSSLKFAEPIVHFFNTRFIQKFNVCWVPDLPANQSILGRLSNQSENTIPVTYIGQVSRMQPIDTTIKYQLLVLLSGPEPQRTIIENLIWEQLQHLNFPICIVRGTTESTKLLNIPKNIEVHDLAKTPLLNKLIAESKMVVCRSGFSTISDLLRLNKRAVLIPTPGQTEQEYLADFLQSKNLFGKITQHQIPNTDFNNLQAPNYEWEYTDELLLKAVQQFSKIVL